MELLRRERELQHARDALAQARRELPWEKVEKTYAFDSNEGKKTLSDLFDGRSQLVVYHFMFAPDWNEGCQSCTFWADGFDRSVVHLAHRDVTLLAISRAPMEKLNAYRKRFDWSFRWLSSGGTDFNQDYHVSFDPDETGSTYNYVPRTLKNPDLPGFSVFSRDAESGNVFHTYSTYARGIDAMNPAYQILDIVPKGRDEDPANPFKMSWLRRRDQYDARA